MRLKDDIDFAYSREVDIDDCWSQAYALYKRDKNYGEVTKQYQQIIEDYNRDFQRLDEVHELINKYLEAQSEDCETYRLATATDIMSFINEMEFPVRFMKNVQFGRALKFFNFEQVSVRIGTIPKKYYKIYLKQYWKDQSDGVVWRSFLKFSENSKTRPTTLLQNSETVENTDK